jgi:hypothetical protein
MSALAHHNDQQVPSPSAPTQKPNTQNTTTLYIPYYIPSFAHPGDETDRLSTMLKI